MTLLHSAATVKRISASSNTEEITMDNNLDKFIDDSVRAWIEENKENLQTMYESYIEDPDQASCTFEEFAVYAFYELGH